MPNFQYTPHKYSPVTRKEPHPWVSHLFVGRKNYGIWKYIEYLSQSLTKVIKMSQFNPVAETSIKS